MNTYPLVKCTKCKYVYINTNLALVANNHKKYELPDDLVVPENKLVTTKWEHTDPTIIDNTLYEACPECGTDFYLVEFKGELCESDYRLFECDGK